MKYYIDSLWSKGIQILSNNLTPIILAGGSGTRLWPLSRKQFPKQFHKFKNEKTMLQQTILRLKMLKSEPPIIICNESHKFIVKDQISQINIKCKILVEPLSKNTAPAITLASLLLNSDTNALILSADHLIEDKKSFQKQVKKGLLYANDNKIVIFGIKPTAPNINYGYIEALKMNNEAFEVSAFKEKPNINLAKKYLKNKNYFWNSGIFLFKISTFLKELKIYDPKILKICTKTAKTISTDQNFGFFDVTDFSKCPDISIDYSIMEKTKKTIMIPLDAKWSDIGTWNAILDISKKNKDGNVLKGSIVTSKSENSLIYGSNNKLVATHGIKDLVIIDTKDALLVSSTKESESIKDLVEKVKNKSPEKVSVYPDENRPWGSFESISKGDAYQVKKIIVKPNGQLSLQKHKYRSEHWVVVSGEAEVTKGKDKFILYSNQSIYIPKGMLHSLKNNSTEDLIIIEVQTGTYLGEDDIERFADIYGRQ